jgi:hypothetical protein
LQLLLWLSHFIQGRGFGHDSSSDLKLVAQVKGMFRTVQIGVLIPGKTHQGQDLTTGQGSVPCVRPAIIEWMALAGRVCFEAWAMVEVAD